MLDMDTLDKLKPDWTNRRRYIKFLLIFLCVVLALSLVGSAALAYFSKFGLYISSYFIVFTICSFAALLGIIGSYIFQSAWSTKDFLNILPGIIPNIGNKDKYDDDDEGDGLSLEEILQGKK